MVFLLRAIQPLAPSVVFFIHSTEKDPNRFNPCLRTHTGGGCRCKGRSRSNEKGSECELHFDVIIDDYCVGTNEDRELLKSADDGGEERAQS